MTFFRQIYFGGKKTYFERQKEFSCLLKRLKNRFKTRPTMTMTL